MALIPLKPKIIDIKKMRKALDEIYCHRFNILSHENFVSNIRYLYENLTPDIELNYENLINQIKELFNSTMDLSLLKFPFLLILKLCNFNKIFFNLLDLKNITYEKKICENELLEFDSKQYMFFKIFEMCQQIISKRCNNNEIIQLAQLILIQYNEKIYKNSNNQIIIFLSYLLTDDRNEEIYFLKKLQGERILYLEEYFIVNISIANLISNELKKYNDITIQKEFLLSDKNLELFIDLIPKIQFNLLKKTEIIEIFNNKIDSQNFYSAVEILQKLNYIYMYELYSYLIYEKKRKNILKILIRNINNTKIDNIFIDYLLIDNAYLKYLSYEQLEIIIQKNYHKVFLTSYENIKLFIDILNGHNGSKKYEYIIKLLDCNVDENILFDIYLYTSYIVLNRKIFIIALKIFLLKIAYTTTYDKKIIKILNNISTDDYFYILIDILFTFNREFYCNYFIKLENNNLLFNYYLLEKINEFFHLFENKTEIISFIENNKFLQLVNKNLLFNIILIKKLKLKNIVSYLQNNIKSHKIFFHKNQSLVSIEDGTEIQTRFNIKEIEQKCNRLNEFSEGFYLNGEALRIGIASHRFNILLSAIFYNHELNGKAVIFDFAMERNGFAKLFFDKNEIIFHSKLKNFEKRVIVEKIESNSQLNLRVKFNNKSLQIFVNGNKIKEKVGRILSANIGEKFYGIFQYLFFYDGIAYEKEVENFIGKKFFYINILEKLEKNIQYKNTQAFYLSISKPYHIGMNYTDLQYKHLFNNNNK